MTLAVTGATGFVGQAVVDEACRRGIALRALARREQAPCDGVEWVRGDLADDRALRALVAGSSAVLHIAGVVNPPEAQKYGYWTNDAYPKDPDAWCNAASEHQGSWWPEWQAWIEQFTDGKVPARQPGDGKLKVLEDAPGSYVKLQAHD